jgi:hypothetical protein
MCLFGRAQWLALGAAHRSAVKNCNASAAIGLWQVGSLAELHHPAGGTRFHFSAT